LIADSERSEAAAAKRATSFIKQRTNISELECHEISQQTTQTAISAQLKRQQRLQ
jgi:hypothetical protein